MKLFDQIPQLNFTFYISIMYILVTFSDSTKPMNCIQALNTNDLTTELLAKNSKIGSTAVEEIKKEKKKILKSAQIDTPISATRSYITPNNRQKGRDNHSSSLKFLLVTLPKAQSIHHEPTKSGAVKQKGGKDAKLK